MIFHSHTLHTWACVELTQTVLHLCYVHRLTAENCDTFTLKPLFTFWTLYSTSLLTNWLLSYTCGYIALSASLLSILPQTVHSTLFSHSSCLSVIVDVQSSCAVFPVPLSSCLAPPYTSLVEIPAACKSFFTASLRLFLGPQHG